MFIERKAGRHDVEIIGESGSYRDDAVLCDLAVGQG